MAPDPVPPVPLERLLEHRPWVRSLARALVRDPWDADDLEQDLWLASMESPPEREGAVRRWFRVVARHAAGKTRRGEGRRRAREEVAARPEAEKSTAEVVAEAEALRRVVVAVMNIEEPYRATVLLRWFEDLPPAAIATRQGIPLETVRTRLRRAVERLRERLDEENRGDRKAWVLALLPLTRPLAGSFAGNGGPAGHGVPAGAAATAGAAGTGIAALVGGMLMAKKAVAITAAALLLVAGAAWFAFRPAPEPGTGDGSPRSVAGGPSDGSGSAKPAGNPVPVASTVLAKAPAAPAGETLEVRVRDSRGATLPGVKVTLHPVPAVDNTNYFYFSATVPAEPPQAIADGTTDASGRVRLEYLEPGERILGAVGEGWARAMRTVTLLAHEPREPLILTLVPACSLTGRVFDADGRPVTDVSVVAAGPGAWKVNSTGLARCPTDAEGRYRLDGLEPGATTVSVWRKAGLRQNAGWVLLPGVSTFDIRLGRGVTLRGRVLDDATGNGIRGAEVFAWATGDGSATAAAATDGDGRFEFRDFPPWTLIPLVVDAQGFLPYPDSPVYAVERVGVQLSAGSTVEREVRLKRGAVLRGRVADAAGTGIPGVLVSVGAGDILVGRSKTAPVGSYRMEGLASGPSRVTAWAEGWTSASSSDAPVDLAPDHETALDIVLQPCPAVLGRVVDGGGKPVEGIRIIGKPGGSPTAFSLADGSFRVLVSPGDGRTLEATASGGRRGRSGVFPVDPAKGAVGIEVVLEPGATIAGTLRREDGTAPEAADVRLVDAVPNAQEPWTFESRSGAAGRIPLEADGSFRIEGVVPGSFTLVGSAAGCPPVSLVVDAVKPGETREGQDLVLVAGAMLEGKVTGGAGVPVPGALITVTSEERALTGRMDSKVAAITDAEGHFTCGPFPGAPQRISVRAAGYLPGAASGMPGGDPLTLVLAPVLSIAGVVVDELDGHPLAGVTVAAVPESVAGPFWSGPFVSTGADGTFRIQGVVAGTYKVRACVDWTGTDYVETEVGGVAAGTEGLRIQAGKGLAIGGRVTGATGGLPPGVPWASVRRKVPEGSAPQPERSGYVRADGSFRIGGLVPGEYEVSIEDHSGMGRTVFLRAVLASVPAGTTDLVVKVVPGVKIAGRVVLEGGTPLGRE